MVLFILFPGGNTSPKEWDKGNSHFLSQLKKIGNVYVYENKFNNSCHYDKSKYNHDEYPNDINFGMEYLNPEKHIEIVYNDTNHHDKKYIPIGFSAGGLLATLFANKYKNDCLSLILLDSIITIPKFIEYRLKYLDNTEYASQINETKLEILQEKIRKDQLKEDCRKLIDVEHYFFAQYAKQNMTEKLEIKTISFINLEIHDDGSQYITDPDFNNTAKIEACDTFKKINYDVYHYRYFVNKTHGFFHNIECCDEIISTIKYLILHEIS
jgi:pimeloyl-ACP methyl ester carboxylesterase